MKDLQHLSELKAIGAEHLRELQQLRVKMTELGAAMMAQGLNGVLETATGVIDATGGYGRDYRAPYAAISIVNNSADVITVTNAGADSRPPGAGAGSWEVAAGRGVVINLVGTHVHFYGAPAGRFSYTIFSKPQPPGFG